MKFCPYFSQRLVNLLNLVHGKSEHWKQCVILFSKQHKWNVLHFSQREPFCSAPLQELFSLVYMGQPPQKTPQAGIRPLYDFIQPAFSPSKNWWDKVGWLCVSVPLLLYSLFSQKWTGCQAYFWCNSHDSSCGCIPFYLI